MVMAMDDEMEGWLYVQASSSSTEGREADDELSGSGSWSSVSLNSNFSSSSDSDIETIEFDKPLTFHRGIYQNLPHSNKRGYLTYCPIEACDSYFTGNETADLENHLVSEHSVTIICVKKGNEKKPWSMTIVMKRD